MWWHWHCSAVRVWSPPTKLTNRIVWLSGLASVIRRTSILVLRVPPSWPHDRVCVAGGVIDLLRLRDVGPYRSSQATGRPWLNRVAAAGLHLRRSIFSTH